MANQQLVNSFRVLAGKEEVDYSKKKTANISIVVMRKPGNGKKMYQNIVLHLDAAIDKVDNLTKDVEIQRIKKKWDEMNGERHQEEKRAV